MASAKKVSKEKDFSQPRAASFIPSVGPALGLPSPLGQTMSSQRSTGRQKKDMSTPLLLTALVDAFSILVIFLLVQVSGVPNLFENDERIDLPKATAIETDPQSLKSLNDMSSLNLVILNGAYVLNGEKLNAGTLRARLLATKSTKQKTRILIQADEKNDFDLLAPVLSMTAEAGISSLEFAVQADQEGVVR